MSANIGVSVLSFAHGHVGSYCQKMMGFDDVNLISAWDENHNRGQGACERYEMKYTPHIEDILNNPSVDLVMIGSESLKMHCAIRLKKYY